MSPERGAIRGTIMEESENIKSHLLDVRKRVRDEIVKLENDLLSNKRSDLGYKEINEISTDAIIDTNISDKTPVITPNEVAKVLPLSLQSIETTQQSRENISKILTKEDDRLIVIVGPCSIHDPEGTLDYAEYLINWRSKYHENLEIIMRAYMEKPRSELGWKGLIYDPKLDDSNNINLGIVVTRMLACQITSMGAPIAMERLNANTPQYFNGLVAYDAIGARNTLDQKAREYASGTSSPVGFKNTVDGDISGAIQAVKTANAPHTFLGINMNGLPMQVSSDGNELAHIILRGSKRTPNYRREHIKKAVKELKEKNLLEAILIDASHDNSGKIASKQRDVVKDVCGQVGYGDQAICGVMLESYLKHGKQPIAPLETLEYGISITDECVSTDETDFLLNLLAGAVTVRRNTLAARQR